MVSETIQGYVYVLFRFEAVWQKKPGGSTISETKKARTGVRDENFHFSGLK